MMIAQLCWFGAALLCGAVLGVGLGSPLWGLVLGITCMAAIPAVQWLRRERMVERRQAQHLAVLSAFAQRAIRDGAVHPCHACKRAVAAGGRQCMFCGALPALR